MKHRNLWLGTAFVGLLIGSSVSAGAQQYYYPYKQSDKPAVEVDMGVLDAPDAPAAAAPVSSEKTRVAGYSYVRSPSMQDAPDDQPVVVPPADAPIAPANIAPIPPATAPQIVTAPLAFEPVTPAPEKKKRPKKVAQKPTKNKPSLIVTDEPSPSAVPKPAAPAANAPIISMPPPAPEAAQTTPAYHDMQGAAPIISNPPDSGAPPVATGAMPDMKALAPVAPVVAPAPVVAAPAPVEAPPVAAAPEPTPAPSPSPAYESLFKPAPEPAPAPAPSVAPAEPAMTTAAPPEAPAAQTGSSAPLPDITVIHGADYPQDSEPPPAVEPADLAKAPRGEPLPLPKSHKPGHTTAQMLAPVEPAPAPQPETPEPAMEPVAPAPAVAATPAPAEAPADAMPVVPAIADLTLGFSGNSSDLSAEAQKKLDAIIRQMSDTVDGRLQVRGYATGEDGSKSSARRIALSRALMVRSYLMDKGVKPTRVDVRALGTDTERSPIDRVDLIFVR